MRWDELFDDLEAQFDAAEAADFGAEISDRARTEFSQLRLVDRLTPARHRIVSVRVLGVGLVEARLVAHGPDWLLLGEVGGRETLVAARAVLSIAGLTAQSASPQSEGAVAARLDLAYALRGIARDRSAVVITLIDGSTSTGTIDRVGADFFEVAEHAAGELRRREAVRGVRAYPLRALTAVSRA